MSKTSSLKKKIVTGCFIAIGLIITGFGIKAFLPTVWSVLTLIFVFVFFVPIFGLFHSFDTEIFKYDDYRESGVFQEEKFGVANSHFKEQVKQACPVGAQFTRCGEYFADLSDWTYIKIEKGGGTYHYTHKIFGSWFWYHMNVWNIQVSVNINNQIIRSRGTLSVDSFYI